MKDDMNQVRLLTPEELESVTGAQDAGTGPYITNTIMLDSNTAIVICATPTWSQCVTWHKAGPA